MSLLGQLPVLGSTVVLREAVAEDVPGLVQLLAADQLGSTRDGISTAADLQPYLRAFGGAPRRRGGPRPPDQPWVSLATRAVTRRSCTYVPR